MPILESSIKKYLLELTVLVTGAVVMIFELVGIRVLAPYVGSSIIVWTSLIGIVLGSLSVGYWYGGKLADRKPSYKTLGFIILSAGLLIGLANVTKDFVLTQTSSISLDLRFRVLISTLLLFSPPTILLGMVLPFSVRLKIKKVNRAGSTAGNLYAFSTVGSVLGTFLAGFVLITYLGTTNILNFLAVILFIISVPYFIGKNNSILVLILLLIVFLLAATGKPIGLLDVDTQYSRIILNEESLNGRQVLTMRTGPFGIQSAMYLDGDEDLAINYTKYFRLGKHFNKDIKSALMIGGGAYSYPKDFLSSFDEAKIDVVEIDPEVTQLSKKYFDLRESPRLGVYHLDGRVFLNTNKRKYDAIYVDAFNQDLTIPFHLTTWEAISKMYDSLNSDGVLITNIVSSIEGDTGRFLRSQLATYRSIFPQAYVFPVQKPSNANSPQNIILVALKTTQEPEFTSENLELNKYLTHLWSNEITLDVPLLTDDFAPVDQFMI